jgi:hypothetical protein
MDRGLIGALAAFGGMVLVMLLLFTKAVRDIIRELEWFGVVPEEEEERC